MKYPHSTIIRTVSFSLQFWFLLRCFFMLFFFWSLFLHCLISHYHQRIINSILLLFLLPLRSIHRDFWQFIHISHLAVTLSYDLLPVHFYKLGIFSAKIDNRSKERRFKWFLLKFLGFFLSIKSSMQETLDKSCFR